MKMEMSDVSILQFVPFSSALDASFWYKLTQQKLDVYRLDDQPVNICGYYTNREVSSLPPLANIDYTSFNENLQIPPFCFPLYGTLLNTNTLEEFKVKDKKCLINSVGEKIWKAISSGEAFQDPSVLLQIICLTYSDLKKYHYYYWLAFPALLFPETSIVGKPQKLQEYFNEDQILQIQQGHDALISVADKAFFLVFISEDKSISVMKLVDYQSLKCKPGKILLGFADPCTLDSHPGWPLRNFLSLIAYYWGKDETSWEVICFRECTKEGKRMCGHSPVINIHMESTEIPEKCPRIVGWEKHKNKLIPRKVDMSASMDPIKLAESAVDLNLKLMRWRLIPELELESIMSAKCLLLGTGTLGCNVARCLLGWGVRNITLIDNSSVSYSNPVRQSLFTFQDCLHGGKQKVKAAVESLEAIFPGINVEGKILTIPMPGHALSQNTIDTTRADILQLEALIESHDVIFLLMDTRESRWLPTVIGAAKRKLIINAALGFDTFLVVRHGLKEDTSKSPPSLPDHIIPGSQLGCYFCNDVVAPGNSTRDRTLDQQCTVTRPGVSYIAAALAVELMVSILQHPDRGRAPAITSARDDHLSIEMATPLGIIPHQIRGYLARFHNILPASKAFDRCIACSLSVLKKYVDEGFEFLLKVFNEPNYLEDLTGLTELHNNINMDDVWELSDDESA